jgi:hypothetical protein
MALLHKADIVPSKLELLAGWAPGQPWFSGNASAALTTVATFRLDDPAGEVGIETLLIQAGDGPLLQVPLTYRGAPLVGGEAWLVGTMQHSVLGARWVYDATGDPVYLAEVAATALTGGVQAEQYIEQDGERIMREPTARVVGDGTHAAATPAVPAIGAVATRHENNTTVTDAGKFQVVVLRHLATPGHHTDVATSDTASAPTATLAGTWPAQPDAQRLVLVTVTSP